MRSFGFETYGGPEVARLIDVPEPVPGPGQVLVEMRAAGVNPADIKVRNGERRDTIPVAFPMAMGREAAGVVVAVGPGVTAWSPGDEVFGAAAAATGALAELVLLDAAATARRPQGVAWEQVACIPVAAGTAQDVLDQLSLPAGSTLLVLGAGGGVGTLTVQLARARSIRVLGVASAGKRDLVESFGATHLDSAGGWVESVRESAPDGLDALLDLVGGTSLDRGHGLLRRGAPLISVAAPARAAALGGGGATRRRTERVFAEVAALVADGVLTVPISARLPLTRAAEAVAAVESGHAAGKVVVHGEGVS